MGRSYFYLYHAYGKSIIIHTGITPSQGEGRRRFVERVGGVILGGYRRSAEVLTARLSVEREEFGGQTIDFHLFKESIMLQESDCSAILYLEQCLNV